MPGRIGVPSRTLALVALVLITQSGCTPYVEHKIYASDASADDAFGRDVDMWGNHVIVGAPFADGTGAAYVFERQAQGGWQEVRKLASPPGSNMFGSEVAVSQSHAVVSTWISRTYPRGAVFVYLRSGSGWSLTQTLQPEGDGGGAGYGSALDLDGGRIIVGDFGDDTNGPGSGAAWIYRLGPTGWLLESKLAPSAVTTDDLFGTGAGISGNLAVVGAERADGAAAFAGAAFVFEYDLASTDWVLRDVVEAGDPGFEDLYGGDVAITHLSPRAVVGAEGDDERGFDAGAAYVVEPARGAWAEARKLTAGDAGAEDHFAHSVDVLGPSVLVGSPDHDHRGSAAGAAYRYFRAGDGSWPGEEVLASDGQAGDSFGQRVALGTALGSLAEFVVGAPGDDDRADGAGAAYVYLPGPDEPFPAPNIVLEPWPYIYVYTGDSVTQQGTPLRFDVVSSAEGLSLAVETAPAHGEVAVDPGGGTVVYRPAAGFVGKDEFRLRATDAKGRSNAALLRVLVEQGR